MAQLHAAGFVERNPCAIIASPAYPVLKKSPDGEVKRRLTIDLRRVNQETLPVVQPLRSIEELLSEVGPARYFGTADLFKGFWQIELHYCRGWAL